MDSNPSPAFCMTHIGKRLKHEDNFLFDGRFLETYEQNRLSNRQLFCIAETKFPIVNYFAISDGLGGYNAGEVASRICVEKLAGLKNLIQNCSNIKEAVPIFQSAIAEINSVVCEMSRRHTELKGMGATLVLFIVCGTDTAILNIGDSRAYYFDFHNNTLTQITKDNTEGQRMLDLGLLTRKELVEFPARKNLSRYIGYGQSGLVLQADEYYPVLENGILILCSDGISDSLSDNQISEILRSAGDLESAGKRLVEEAASTHNADNATAILVPVGRRSCGGNKSNW